MTIYGFLKEELNSKSASKYRMFRVSSFPFLILFFKRCFTFPIFIKYHQLKLSKRNFQYFLLVKTKPKIYNINRHCKPINYKFMVV